MLPKRVWLGFALALCLPSIVALADHVLVITKQGYYLLEQDAAGNPSVHRITHVVEIDKPGPTPTPTPFPPPNPAVSLTDVVKTATASVPDYAEKVTHRRAMAFGMNFLAQATSGATVDKSRAAVRQFCDAAVGGNSSQWAVWWSAVDAKLNSLALTPAAYTAALREMATALTADLPPAAANVPAEAFGLPSYGLSPEFLNFLMTVLLPLLLKLLGVATVVASFVCIA